METLQERIAAVVAKHEAQYGAAWDKNGIDKNHRMKRWDSWKLATCTKQVKSKFKDVLFNVGDVVLYDPASFERFPLHHRPRFRNVVFVTVFAERGLTAIGCATSLRADSFDFGTEPIVVVNKDMRGDIIK